MAVKPNNRQGGDKDGGVVHNAAVFSIEATGFNFLRVSHLDAYTTFDRPSGPDANDSEGAFACSIRRTRMGAAVFVALAPVSLLAVSQGSSAVLVDNLANASNERAQGFIRRKYARH